MVFQDPTQSLNPRMTVFQLISEAWVIHPEILPKERWRTRVGELLAEVGLSPEHANRYPHQFSGTASADRHCACPGARARTHHLR